VPIRLFAPFVGKPINVARLRHGMKKRRLSAKAATVKGLGARFATERTGAGVVSTSRTSIASSNTKAGSARFDSKDIRDTLPTMTVTARASPFDRQRLLQVADWLALGVFDDRRRCRYWHRRAAGLA
jgi:hypothetical protein